MLRSVIIHVLPKDGRWLDYKLLYTLMDLRILEWIELDRDSALCLGSCDTGCTTHATRLGLA